MTGTYSYRSFLGLVRLSKLKLIHFAIISLVCLPVFSYWNVDQCGFVHWDDDQYVTQNYRIHAGPNSDNLRWAFTHFRTANWHPLTWMSHALDCKLYGLAPAGHHLTSLFIHIVNVLLVFLLFNKMTGATWRSFLVAAIFAVHPQHVESVAWVSERKDVLSACFFLLALLSYVVYSKERKKRFYILSIFVYFCALLSKPMVVTLPFILFLLDYWPLKRMDFLVSKADTAGLHRHEHGDVPTLGRLIIEKVPFLISAFLVSLVTIYSQRSGGAIISQNVLPLEIRFENAMVSYVGYLAKTFWPLDLSPFYPYRVPIPAWDWILSGMLIVSLFIGALMRIRKSPSLAVGLLWFTITLLPVIGIVQVGAQSSADRYMYIPHIGLFAAVVWYGCDVSRRNKVIRIIACICAVVAVLAISMLTRKQVEWWENDHTLATRMLETTGENEVAYSIRASYYLQNGQTEKGMADLFGAAYLHSQDPVPWVNIGFVYLKKEHYLKALHYFNIALTIDKKFLSAHYNSAKAYMGLNNLAKAMEHYRAVLDVDPHYTPAMYWLGFVLYVAGNLEESRQQLLSLLILQPENIDALYQIGAVEIKLDLSVDAIKHLEKAASLSPQSADICNKLGVAFIGVGDTTRAKEYFAKAISLDPNHIEALENQKNCEKTPY